MKRKKKINNFSQQLHIIYIAFVLMANKRAKGQLRVAVIIPVSIIRHRIKYQHVSMDESAAPFRPAVVRAAVCPGNDSVSRNGPQGPRPENSKTICPYPTKLPLNS